jgi:hypothetical protein
VCGNWENTDTGNWINKVWHFNPQNGRSMSLGCWVRQTNVPKHVWTCSSFHLHEPQTNWVLYSQASEVVVCVRGILLTEKWVLHAKEGACGSIIVQGTMLQGGRSPVRVPDEVDFFNLPNPFQPHYGPEVDSASNRNEYQESSWA